MSQVAISGNASGTGTLTIASPNTNSNYTLTLPQTTATLSIDGPAFSAYANTTQSITANTATKVAINTEIFDTNSNFDSTTNYRFTPTVAGYYQINGTVRGTGTAVNAVISNLYKNGATYASGAQLSITNPPFALQATFSEVVYLNGSTDYVELYGFVYATSGATFDYAASDITSRFSGCLVRGA